MHMSLAVPLGVTVILIASVTIMSVLAWIDPPLKRAFILNPYIVRTKLQVHRLLTAGWIHADVGHLVFNMVTLYFFAGDVLRALDAPRFIVLYVTAVVVSFIPSTLRYMGAPRYSTLGASGAVAAIMFSAVLLYPGLQLYLYFLPVPVPGIFYALAYLAYSAWHSYRSRDGINHDSHFYGAIYGALITYAFEPSRVERTVRHLF